MSSCIMNKIRINSLSDEILLILNTLRKLIYAHARFIQRYYYPRETSLNSSPLIRYVFQTSLAFGLTRQDIRRIVGGSAGALMDKYITSLSPAKGAR